MRFRKAAGAETDGASSAEETYRNGPTLIIGLGLLSMLLAFASGMVLSSALASGIGLPLLLGGFALILAIGAFAYMAMIPSRIVRTLIYQASEILFTPYGEADRLSAFRFLYDYIFWKKLPTLIFTDGKIDERTHDSLMVKWGYRGPGHLVIDSHTAVLVERQEVMRVLTLGSHFLLDKSDWIRGAVDLTLKQEPFEMLNVFTKDGIPLHITGAFQFRVAQLQDPLVQRGKFTPDPQAVRLAIWAAPDWESKARLVALSKIRDLFAEYTLNEIHGSFPQIAATDPNAGTAPIAHTFSPRACLQDDLTQASNAAVRAWGAEVVSVTIDEISMPEEVKKTLREAWAAQWTNTVKIEAADTQARVELRQAQGQLDAAVLRREAELALADGSAKATDARAKAVADAFDELAEHVRQTSGGPVDSQVLAELLRAAGISAADARPSDNGSGADGDKSKNA